MADAPYLLSPYPSDTLRYHAGRAGDSPSPPSSCHTHTHLHTSHTHTHRKHTHKQQRAHPKTSRSSWTHLAPHGIPRDSVIEVGCTGGIGCGGTGTRAQARDELSGNGHVAPTAPYCVASSPPAAPSGTLPCLCCSKMGARPRLCTASTCAGAAWERKQPQARWALLVAAPTQTPGSQCCSSTCGPPR